MIRNEGLRARLGELTRTRRLAPATTIAPGVVAPGDGAPATPAPAQAKRARKKKAEAPPHSEIGVEAFLPGGEWHDDAGAVYIHERLRSEIETREEHWGRLATPPANEPDLIALAKAGLERALFLDLETGGLSSSPVFLAGTMHWNGEDFVLRQYFARHYGEEGALLRALGAAMREFDFLITFNGKSYDAPFLANRAVIHGAHVPLPPRHIDLLHMARRRWKHELRDCKLQTLEYHVCRRKRVGDVAGEEVPGLYHDFVKHGDPWRLVPVFHHNLLDVITMGEIVRALCVPPKLPRDGKRWYDFDVPAADMPPEATPILAANGADRGVDTPPRRVP